ncbi:MAG TPA: universal stress protein [Solirubrobacteraceae bacterium]|nr:universal stress protein [Solirubrobacteraceae bacterium]
MTTVLAALDSNASARPVLSTAIVLADLYDSTVTGLHVREEALSAAAELARAAGVELREVSGDPVEEIVNAARDPDVAALVLGARGGHGGPQPAGHTALKVITRIPKPVAVVPPHAHPPERIERILVPLDGSSQASQTLDETIRLAHRRGLEVLVLHVHSPATVPAFSDHEPHATLAWEREFLTRHISTPHDRITLLRRLGVPADDVVAVAHETGPDLIVIAWNQDLTPGRARVVSETLAHTDIPVLLLPVQ